MNRADLTASIEGIGFWADGLPSWPAARAFATAGTLPGAAPARPAPQLLAPNERRRAPDTVAVALEVALAACTAAGRDPAALPSVFALLALDRGLLPGTLNSTGADPACGPQVRFDNAERPLRYAMNNSFGFGGNNCSLLFGAAA
jgi:hypothetical protein